MKLSLFLTLLSLPTSFASAATVLRADCESQIQVSVAAAEGLGSVGDDNESVTINEETRKSVKISQVKAIASRPEAGGPDGGRAITYAAKVAGSEGLKGTVVVQATRGGCFVKKMSLAE